MNSPITDDEIIKGVQELDINKASADTKEEPKQRVYPRLGDRKKLTDLEAEAVPVEKIREIEIGKHQSAKQSYKKEVHNCSICMSKLVLKFSLYLCYECNQYMCEKCLKAHDKKHTVVKRKSEKIERKEFGNNFVMSLRAEKNREERLEDDNMELFGRVNVRYHLDEYDCEVTGLCSLHDQHWAMLDYNNSCMKIFSSVTNTLQRYINFGPELRGITEIRQDASISNSISEVDHSSAAKIIKEDTYYIVVTVGDLKQIWFINTKKKPAEIEKEVPLDKKCFSIDTYENKLYVLCREDVESGYRYSVAILASDGSQLSTIQNDIYTLLVSDIVVSNGRVYISDYFNDKILCINVADGENIAQLPKKGFGPTGISADSRNNVYVCASGQNKIYILRPDLTEKGPLDLNKDYTIGVEKLCFSKDKLFIVSSLHNIINVILMT